MAACFDTTHGDKGWESGRKRRRTCSVTPGRATQGKKGESQLHSGGTYFLKRPRWIAGTFHAKRLFYQ